MADVLAEICAVKREEVERRKRTLDWAALEAALPSEPPRRFADRLSREVAATGFGLIAELKKASPSKGVIRDDFDPPALARAYAAGGASCLSVLTDGPYFQGDDAFLRAARAAVELPVLRKDFMLEPWQILESRTLGADAVLLIMAALGDDQAAELEAAAFDLGMDVLLEVHDADELERALRLRSTLIGINNRDLKTLKVDLTTTERLTALVPQGRDVVCESGLLAHDDLARMAGIGVRRFLVGEALMRHDDVAGATAALLGRGGARRPPPPPEGLRPVPDDAGLAAEANTVPGAPVALTHFDPSGNAVMVDVGAKPATERAATAGGRVVMLPRTLERIGTGGFAKGDVLTVAQLAGIMGAKRTPDLIPLCHPLALSSVAVTLEPDAAASAVEIRATCKVTGPTGVEMEALTAVMVAALTVYDMCKAVDRGMRIEGVRLLEKSGGASGRFSAGP